MSNFGIQSNPAGQNQIPQGAENLDAGPDKLPQNKFNDLTYQPVSPERQLKKAEAEEKSIMKLVEKEFEPTAKPAQAAASATAKEVEQSSTKSSNIAGGASEDLHREIKKKTTYKVASADSGSMKEVDHRKERDDSDPKKEKKHKEFMFDLMALLVRLGIIKKK